MGVPGQANLLPSPKIFEMVVDESSPSKKAKPLIEKGTPLRNRAICTDIVAVEQRRSGAVGLNARGAYATLRAASECL